jgi:hypothetical protein
MIDWLFSKERAITHAFARAEELLQWDDGAEIHIVVAHSDGTEEKRHTFVGANPRSLRAG